MHAGVLSLLGSLALGGPPASAAPATPLTAAAPVAPVVGTRPDLALASGRQPAGIFPVPGIGPPGAVAAVGSRAGGTAEAGPAGGVLPTPAPLVAARFLTPKDVRVTAYPGSPLARMFDTPVTLALRPGYVYRFELTNLPYNPGRALYPEVEVRGSLVPRPGMNYLDYPIPLAFGPADIERALSGAVITKVIYLEDPQKAIPVEVKSDYPVETPEDNEAQALKAARENGRVMAIVRLGDRKPSARELEAVAIDGTILMPNEKYLKSPAVPPVLPYWNWPLFDPVLGPRLPQEECFVNGDDKKERLGIGLDNRLGGLDATDVAVEYTMGGKRKVATSCMVCICAPRYLIRRAELLPSGFDVLLRPAGLQGEVKPLSVQELRTPAAVAGRDKPTESVGRARPAAYIGRLTTGVLLGTSRPSVFAQVAGLKVEGTYVEPEQLTAYPLLCPLTVTKTIDPQGPRQAGDIVTVTIRYANTGTKVASDIVLSDSLSGRLEYVPGSAQTDRPANFSLTENEVGSVILRWELPGELMPGQAGTVKFRAKVR